MRIWRQWTRKRRKTKKSAYRGLAIWWNERRNWSSSFLSFGPKNKKPILMKLHVVRVLAGWLAGLVSRHYWTALADDGQVLFLFFCIFILFNSLCVAAFPFARVLLTVWTLGIRNNPAWT
jgi:hypothetical protein